MNLPLTTLILAWIVGGFITYGITLAYYNAKWPQFAHGTENLSSHKKLAWLLALCGFGGTIAVFFLSGCAKYGLKWKNLSIEETREAYRKIYPHLNVPF